MEISRREREGVTILEPRGRITLGAGEEELRDALHELLQGGYPPILVSLEHVELIDSAVIGVLVAARTTAVNRGAEAGMQPELPQLPAALSGGGGVFAGVILVGLGILLLSHTILGFSMAWLAEWWPLFLIIFGLRMIFAARGRDQS